MVCVDVRTRAHIRVFPVCVCGTQTCCRARWMSMPCPQGAGGLARHSPALPLREMSILCLLKFWKAVDMTFTPSYVRAPVYCKKRVAGSNAGKKQTKNSHKMNIFKSTSSAFISIIYGVSFWWCFSYFYKRCSQLRLLRGNVTHLSMRDGYILTECQPWIFCFFFDRHDGAKLPSTDRITGSLSTKLHRNTFITFSQYAADTHK